MNCFKISGSAANPVLPSSILPGISIIVKIWLVFGVRLLTNLIDLFRFDWIWVQGQRQSGRKSQCWEVAKRGEDWSQNQQVHHVALHSHLPLWPQPQDRCPNQVSDEGIQRPPWISLRPLLRHLSGKYASYLTRKSMVPTKDKLEDIDVSLTFCHFP